MSMMQRYEGFCADREAGEFDKAGQAAKAEAMQQAARHMHGSPGERDAGQVWPHG